MGKFVTIEGCEGVGKSTLLKKLARYFEENKYDAIFTREPGGTPGAEKIRNVILDANNAEMTDTTELMLYAAARAQHTEELILPALKEDKIVICDRYSDSTLAYQGYARGLDKELCKTLALMGERGVKIDMTIFLDLPPALGFKRKGGADKGDRLEKENLAFHERVYQGFCDIATNNPDRVVRIDASKTADEVFEAVINAIKQRGIVD